MIDQLTPTLLEIIDGNYQIVIALILLVSLWLDAKLGELPRFHPLIGFGWLVTNIEQGCRRLVIKQRHQDKLVGKFQAKLQAKSQARFQGRVQGTAAWLLAVMPITLGCYLLLEYLSNFPLIWIGANILIVYFTLGGKSLIQHADNIYTPLAQGDIEASRQQVSLIVSRNTEQMTEAQISSAAIESVLENGNDAVIAPMVWFIILGAPAALLFRLANTLDAMWGYKTDKYLDFGWCSAKIDDLLGWLPARITALLYAFQGDFFNGLECWRKQAKQCKSPNGGVVMTTGAGALNIQIGGPTYYHGELQHKEPMGMGEVADHRGIPSANKLVSRGSTIFACIWLTLCIAVF